MEKLFGTDTLQHISSHNNVWHLLPSMRFIRHAFINCRPHTWRRIGTALLCDFVYSLCARKANKFTQNIRGNCGKFIQCVCYSIYILFERGKPYKGRCGQSSVLWFLIRRTCLKILPFRYSDTDILASGTCRSGDNFT